MEKVKSFLCQGALADHRGANTLEWVAIMCLILAAIKEVTRLVSNTLEKKAGDIDW